MPMIIAMTSYKVRFCHDWSTLACNILLDWNYIPITVSKLQIICIRQAQCLILSSSGHIDPVIISYDKFADKLHIILYNSLYVTTNREVKNHKN